MRLPLSLFALPPLNKKTPPSLVTVPLGPSFSPIPNPRNSPLLCACARTSHSMYSGNCYHLPSVLHLAVLQLSYVYTTSVTTCASVEGKHIVKNPRRFLDTRSTRLHKHHQPNDPSPPLSHHAQSTRRLQKLHLRALLQKLRRCWKRRRIVVVQHPAAPRIAAAPGLQPHHTPASRSGHGGSSLG